jgi:hypothetical protein
MSHARRASLLAILFGVAAVIPHAAAQEPVSMKIPAPELKGIEEWINSKPLSWKDLKGKVVVLHFWTFG